MLLLLFSLTCVQTWMWTCWKSRWRRVSSGPGCCHVTVTGTRARRCRQSPAGPGRPAAVLRGMCCGCPPLGWSWGGRTRQRCWCCGQTGRQRVPAELGRCRGNVEEKRRQMEDGIVKEKWSRGWEGACERGSGCREERGAERLEREEEVKMKNSKWRRLERRKQEIMYERQMNKVGCRRWRRRREVDRREDGRYKKRRRSEEGCGRETQS